MNYNKIYNDLIEKARNRVSIDGYYEVHHIIPKCLNGNDEPSNLVKLTAREHFIAHLLLANIHGGLCLYAAYFMYGFKKYTNKGSSWIKEDAIKLLASYKKRSVSQTLRLRRIRKT